MLRFPRLLISLLALVALAIPATAVASPAARPAPRNTPGPVLWSAPASIDTAPIDGVACPSAGLCVAVDRAGRALWSTNPTGGANTWHAAVIDPGYELTAISCPTSALCVAVDAAGNAITSIAPTGGPTAWSVAKIDSSSTQSNSDTAGPVLLRGVSCPSSALCVAVDADGNTLASTDPTGGGPAWTINHADANRSYGCSGGGLACQPPLIGVSCPSVALCAAVDFSGNILTTQSPTGSGPWPSVSTEGSLLGSLWGISCPSVGFCATVDGDANHVVTFSPSQPAALQRRALPDSEYGIWCQSASLCLASAQTPGGLSGLLGSYAPAAPRATWSLSSLGAINGIACPSASVCVAADAQGDVAGGVTTRAIAAALRSSLLPSRGLPTIAALDRTRALHFTLTSPIPARVTLSWTLPGTTLALAATSVRFTHPGTARVTLPLSVTGIRVLRAARARVTVTAVATFAASTGSLRVSANRTLTHPPAPPKPRHHKRRR